MPLILFSNFFKKIRQIYGLFLNWLTFLEKKLFQLEFCSFVIKLLYFRSFKNNGLINVMPICNDLIIK